MTVTSGQKYLPLLKQKGRVGLFAKMWLDTSVWASTRCYLTWQIKPVMKSRHFALVLWPSMPRTDETGFGLWPTATTQDNPQVRGQGKTIGTKPGTTLGGAVRMWPTPTANEDAAGTPNGKMQAMLGNHPDVRGTTPEEWAQGSLNPAWVEHYLMGYPRGWTNLETSQE